MISGSVFQQSSSSSSGYHPANAPSDPSYPYPSSYPQELRDTPAHQRPSAVGYHFKRPVKEEIIQPTPSEEKP